LLITDISGKKYYIGNEYGVKVLKAAKILNILLGDKFK
jgi:hypothetical protein